MGSGAASASLTTALPRPQPTDSEKEFKCPTCARVFNKKANLKVHSRKHTGEKPYACSKPGCGRAFMWKSSVTFHEQNCPSTKRDAPNSPARPLAPPSATAATASLPAAVANGVVTKGVQKRPKGGGSAAARDLASAGTLGTSAAAAAAAVGGGTNPRPRRKSLGDHDRRHDLIGGVGATGKSISGGGGGASSGGIGSGSGGGGGSGSGDGGGGMYSPPPVHMLFSGELDSVLPAPAVLLGEKRMNSGGGKPPMIPGVRGLYPLPKETGPGKIPFDLRVPASSSGKGTALKTAKMPKMPKMSIAMELDDSDDETPEKIFAPQDTFLMTGNPFGGFAPPTRCSPLPISSPIVCPGVSPMPLSPLAPYSPLPPDSPAHNAPNPVHPPLNQTNARPNTPNW